MVYTKPLPALDNWNRPFWKAASEERLVMQACDDCNHIFFPPGPVCPGCLSRNIAWRELSGRGTVESWVVFHQLYYKGFAEDLPYNVAMIRLDEGPRMMSNVVAPNDSLRKDMRVEVLFGKATDDISIPKFRPITDSEA